MYHKQNMVIINSSNLLNVDDSIEKYSVVSIRDEYFLRNDKKNGWFLTKSKGKSLHELCFLQKQGNINISINYKRKK